MGREPFLLELLRAEVPYRGPGGARLHGDGPVPRNGRGPVPPAQSRSSPPERRRRGRGHLLEPGVSVLRHLDRDGDQLLLL